MVIWVNSSFLTSPPPCLLLFHHPPSIRSLIKQIYIQVSCSSMSATLYCGQCILRQPFWRSKVYAVAFVSRSSSTSRRQRALDSITTEDKLAKDSKRRRERADSVSEAMLQDRRRHLERIAEMAQQTEKEEAEEEVTGGGSTWTL